MNTHLNSESLAIRYNSLLHSANYGAQQEAERAMAEMDSIADILEERGDRFYFKENGSLHLYGTVEPANY